MKYVVFRLDREGGPLPRETVEAASMFIAVEWVVGRRVTESPRQGRLAASAREAEDREGQTRTLFYFENE
jgi:hypothetical protein